jgi:hypothetical protein
VERETVLSVRRLLTALACSLALAAPALAGDEAAGAAPTAGSSSTPSSTSSTSSDAAEIAVKLPNFFGLSGMQDLFDARVPTGLTIRGGLRMEQSMQNLQGPIIHFDQQILDLQAYAGVAALELFEVGARLPFEFNRTTKGLKISGGSEHQSGSNLGNFDLAGKISIRFGQLSLAPYAVLTFPTGSPKFDSPGGARVGGAATVSILNSVLNLHANVDGAWISGGNWAIDYKIGVSVVPLATKIVALRPYVFLRGVQQIDNNPGSDLRVAAGVQGLLFDFITVEVGMSYRFLSDTTPHDLPDDNGTWSFNIGAGVAF